MVAIFINFALAHSESLSIIDFITIFIIKGTFNGNFTLYMCLLLVSFMRDIIPTMSTNNTSAIYIFTHFNISGALLKRIKWQHKDQHSV